MADKVQINVGDAIQQSRLPGWLRWIFSLFRGVKIGAGPVDIQLEEGHGIPAARTGLDQPAKFEPPNITGRR